MTSSRLAEAGAIPAPAREAPEPASRRDRMLRLLRRTERRFTVLTTALVTLALAAGLTGALGVAERTALLDDVTGHSSPLTVAALEVYRSLSDADATSASAFLAGGAESKELRDRYRTDIAQSTAALSTAAAGAPAGSGSAEIAALSNYLPTYTGLVETARTYNRQGLPIGAAYLREASVLVRDTMLPRAKQLYEEEMRRLASAQHEAGSLPWTALTLGVLLVAGLLVAQVHLRRRTRRRYNVGLLAATLAALAGLGWLGVAAIGSARHGTTSRTDGTAQIEALAGSRIAGLQARTDEAMSLIARGNGAAFDQHFDATTNALTGPGGLLTGALAKVDQPETRAAVDSAVGILRDWLAAHQELRALDQDGKYQDAVRKAIGGDPHSSGALAQGFDIQLGLAMDQAGGRFDTAAGAARDTLAGAALGLAILTAVAMACTVVGVWPRIAEYR
ncbi:hypothetical protein [Amycolatopsis samaneae]|uniref:Secreted protein n=1 Tax=Amycolatopsis samaneae TaxID=664691 RepID=A0ABW5GSG0_9PSEU